MTDNKEKIIRTTKEGRVYIRTVDFFKQDKVVEMIKNFKNSSIYEQIERHNNASSQQRKLV